MCLTICKLVFGKDDWFTRASSRYEPICDFRQHQLQTFAAYVGEVSCSRLPGFAERSSSKSLGTSER